MGVYARMSISVLLLSLPAAARAQSDSTWLASKGFHERAHHALLHMDRQTIAARRPGSLRQLLADHPQLSISRDVRGSEQILLSPPAGYAAEPCRLTVYLNGVELNPGMFVYDLDLERFASPRDLAGLEVFRGSDAPVGDEDSCGAVLLWVHRLRGRADFPFTGQLRGRLVGMPIAASNLVLTVRDRRVLIAPDGTFDAGVLPAGMYEVRVSAPGAAPFDAGILVRAGRISEIELELSGWTSTLPAA